MRIAYLFAVAPFCIAIAIALHDINDLKQRNHILSEQLHMLVSERNEQDRIVNVQARKIEAQEEVMALLRKQNEILTEMKGDYEKLVAWATRINQQLNAAR